MRNKFNLFGLLKTCQTRHYATKASPKTGGGSLRLF